MESNSNISARHALMIEFNKLKKEPEIGFRVDLVDDANMFEWKVVIYGPPNSIYEGGYFKAQMSFPSDYPFSPPVIQFKSQITHPNIYEDGVVCISILHPPDDNPTSGEPVSEQWNPTQNVRTILLSVISMLTSPNNSSPANETAAVLYNQWISSYGLYDQYEQIAKSQVEYSKLEAASEGIIVPMTVEEYCATGTKPIKPVSESGSCELDCMDFYDALEDEDNEDNPNYSDDNRSKHSSDNKSKHSTDNTSNHSNDNRSKHSTDNTSNHSEDNISNRSEDKRSDHSEDKRSNHSDDNRSNHSNDNRSNHSDVNDSDNENNNSPISITINVEATFKPC